MPVASAIELHESGAPDLANVVRIVGLSGCAGSVAPGAKFAEVIREVGIVRESSNALRIVEYPVAQDGDIVDGASDVVAPAFAHSAALGSIQSVNVHRPAHQPVRDAVSELVEHHRGIECSVPIGTGDQSHVHGRTTTIDFRVHIRCTEDSAGERLGVNGIVTYATAAEIVGLEVAVC